jgi:hypothetical protein
MVAYMVYTLVRHWEWLDYTAPGSPPVSILPGSGAAMAG